MHFRVAGQITVTRSGLTARGEREHDARLQDHGKHATLVTCNDYQANDR